MVEQAKIETKVEAMLALRGGGRSAVGRERIALLEAVETHGSISRAAQAVGLSYKAAWDALNAVNNLLPRPAIVGQTGGRHGGGAQVTEEGHSLIALFRLMEDRIARAAALLNDPGQGRADPIELLWRLGMKTTARNAFRCTVTEIHEGGVNCEVVMTLGEHTTLNAVITRESLIDLEIRIGNAVMALIKSSFVMLATGSSAPLVSTRNRIPGIVTYREDGEVNSEISLSVGNGKSITAIVTREAADDLGLHPGAPAWALFKASHVILAVE